jgi:hypothetical protein
MKSFRQEPGKNYKMIFMIKKINNKQKVKMKKKEVKL